MEPLPTNRRCLIWLSACPPNETANRWQRIGHALFSLGILAVLLFGFTANLLFRWKFISIEVGRSMFAFMFAVSEFGIIYMASVGIISLRHKIGFIFGHLSKIYRAHEDTDSFRFLSQANDISEWMWQNYFKCLAAVLIANVFIAPTVSILYCWFDNKDPTVNNFFHPVPYVLPWNQSTMLGYAGELSVVVLLASAYMVVNGGFLLLFISICQHHQAFYKMLKHAIDKVKHPSDGNIRCDEKFFRDLILFHNLVKDWFSDTADVYSSFIMIQLICSEIMMAISLFYLDFQFQQLGFDVASAITTVSVGVTNILIYCYFGKLATESYAEMSDCVYNMDWYEVPIGLQEYFILMIQNMQQPMYYHGFGVIRLNLETFTKLIRSAISYYISIKAITSK